MNIGELKQKLSRSLSNAMSCDYSEGAEIIDLTFAAIYAAGFAVVPREPTEAMQAAIKPALDAVYNGNKADPGYEYTGNAVYRAMLAAAEKEQSDE